MNISPMGIKRLENREGRRTMMYRDSAGLPTIGVGHLLTKDELSSGKLHLPSGALDWHQGLSTDEINELLHMDLARTESAINAAVAVPLLQYQYDALVSFVFNTGIHSFLDSTLLERLNHDAFSTIPAQMRRWIHSAGAENKILIERRDDEVRQWEGKYD